MGAGSSSGGGRQAVASGAAPMSGAAGADQREFVISRVFDSPREVVFRAWTDPKQMARWWGPRGFAVPDCTMDVRQNGAYRIVMRGFDGGQYPMTGYFQEVVESERLMMTMDLSEHSPEWHDMVKPNRDKSKPPRLEGILTVTFEPHGAGGSQTKLTVRMRLESTEVRDSMVKMGMNEGWSQSLDRLGEALSNPPPPTLANGKVCYIEIPATDIDASAAFYTKVFGWKTRRRGDGHLAFDDSVGEVSGTWVKGRGPSPVPGLLIYIMVDSAEATIERVIAQGGRIVQAIGADAPEITARFSDPAGNVLGIYQQPKQ